MPQELSGRGYGSRLAHGVFEALRRDGKRVIAKCLFMSSYAAGHPEYATLLDG
nr:N-acetyltransferase [Bradyrhizobium neotropicale]